MRGTNLIVVGLEKVLKRINDEVRQVKGRKTDRGLLKAGLYVFSMSQKQVPVVTGTLRSSGRVDPPRRKFFGTESYVQIGYYTVYALKTHENPYSGRTGGFSPQGRPYPQGTWSKVGKWKFLQHPIQYNIPGIMRIIQNEVRIR